MVTIPCSVSCATLITGTYDEVRGNTRYKSVQGRRLVEVAITISTQSFDALVNFSRRLAVAGTRGINAWHYSILNGISRCKIYTCLYVCIFLKNKGAIFIKTFVKTFYEYLSKIEYICKFSVRYIFKFERFTFMKMKSIKL